MSEQHDASEAAERLIERLREFATTLESDERALLAALLAPGIDAAWNEPAEVAGFEWRPDVLPAHLADVIRGRSLRIEGW